MSTQIPLLQQTQNTRSSSSISDDGSESSTDQAFSPSTAKGKRKSYRGKMKQSAYYRYKDDISIYHFCASLLPLPTFRCMLNKPDHGYIDTLTGPDLLSTHTIPDGDEVPAGNLEVCYLPNVFHRGGCALGFRTNNGAIEWLCFSKDIQRILLETLEIENAVSSKEKEEKKKEKVFDLVASVAKPPNKKRSRWVPYTEHRDWFESLRAAGLKECRVRLTWKRFGEELREEHGRVRGEGGDGLFGLEDFEGMELEEGNEDNMEFEYDEDPDGGNEQEGEEEREDAVDDARDETNSPAISGRQKLVIYPDPPPEQDAVTIQKNGSTSSQSSNSSVLSVRSTNTLLVQRPPSSNHKARGEEYLTSENYN